jgi:hypothetical protein
MPGRRKRGRPCRAIWPALWARSATSPESISILMFSNLRAPTPRRRGRGMSSLLPPTRQAMESFPAALRFRTPYAYDRGHHATDWRVALALWTGDQGGGRRACLEIERVRRRRLDAGRAPAHRLGLGYGLARRPRIERPGSGNFRARQTVASIRGASRLRARDRTISATSEDCIVRRRRPCGPSAAREERLRWLPR